MKAVVAAFNQEKALVGAFSMLTNLRMELFQALVQVWDRSQYCLLIGAVPDFSYSYSDYGANTSAATYSDYSEGGTFPIRQTFMNCLEHEKLTWEQQFNTRLSIS